MAKTLSIIVISCIISGCSTFGPKELRNSEAVHKYANNIFSKIDYKILSKQMSLPSSEIKTVGAVYLYSTTNQIFSSRQTDWYFTQRVTRTDGIECYAYLHLSQAADNTIIVSKKLPGSFYCFHDGDKYSKANLPESLVK